MATTKAKRATARATHKGHCQVCGACQKLPGGVLAKHGYTTRWGFFEGTCPGSGHLPFERDKSLIEAAILRVRESEYFTRTEAATTRERQDPEGCWVHAYFAFGFGARRRSGYEWISARIDVPADAVVRSLHYWHPGDQRPARWEQLGYYGPGGRPEAARWSNASYADRVLLARAARLAEYAAWQEGRIASWEPRDLTPID